MNEQTYFGHLWRNDRTLPGNASFFLHERRKIIRRSAPSPRVIVPALHRGEPAMRQHKLRLLAPLEEFDGDQRRLPLDFTKFLPTPILLPIPGVHQTRRRLDLAALTPRCEKL